MQLTGEGMPFPQSYTVIAADESEPRIEFKATHPILDNASSAVARLMPITIRAKARLFPPGFLLTI
jgi:hypothetical protein